jgi:hypothetical protein
MPTADQIASSKEMQNIEASQRSTDADRGQAGADAELDAAALDVAGDADPAPPTESGAPAADSGDVVAPPERVPQPRDEMRDQIVAAMRAKRAASAEALDADEGAADMHAALNRAGIPRELQDAVDTEPAEPGAAPDEPQAPAAARHKLIVRGREQFVTDEQLIDYARKGAAGDDYLGESRAILDEVKRAQAELAARAAQPGTPPANGTEHTTQQQDGGEPPASPFKDAVDGILFGEPEKASDQLERAVIEAVSRIAPQISAAERRNAELARGQQSVQKFAADNPDIAGDDMAEAAVRAVIFRQQRQDLIDIGVDLAKLPNDPAAIANAHLGFRSDPRFAGRVRGMDEFLDTAKAEFKKRFGGTMQQNPNGAGDATGSRPAQQQSAGQPAPRVQVDMDRTARRAAIPQQPARTAALRPAAPAAPAQRSRSETIADMAKARGKILS